MLKQSLLILVLLNFLLISCESGLEGNLNDNLPPTTSLTLSSINLPEGERLLSQVKISWWGDDPDGYVVGYEFIIGDFENTSDEDWTFTERLDSTFILPIPEGETDADVQFTVRAVDNEDSRDIDPPSLTFPIRNTRPEVEFNANETPPDTTFRIVSFGFSASDPDGDSNLNRVEIALNDTSLADNWVEVPLNASLITLRINDSIPTPSAKILIGKAVNDIGLEFSNIILNDNNQLFIRSIDNAGSISEAASHTWFVKKQNSRILFLNDYSGTNSNSRAGLHLDLLNQVGLTEVDYLDISDGVVSGGTRVFLSNAFPDRSLAEPTINLMLAEWDYIYWISDDLNRNIGYALEITTNFFAKGGKMFANIPIEFVSEQNSLFQFLPFQGVQAPPTTRNAEFIVQKCSAISTSEVFSYVPDLRFKANVFPSYPIIPFNESIDLFEGDFEVVLRNPTEIDEYEGIKLVSAMNPDQTVLYFGFDLNDFTTETSNGCTDEMGADLPPSDLKSLVEFITIETLGFKQ